jgi:hypothetical protein
MAGEQTWTGCGTTNQTPNSCVEIKVDVIRYVNKVDENSGWLKVKEGESPLFLHKYCKLMLLGSKNGQTYMKVVEGTHNGKIVRMSTVNVDTYLGKVAPKQEPAVLTVTYGKYEKGWLSQARKRVSQNERDYLLDQQWATVRIGKLKVQATMNSVWNGVFYPIPLGRYRILLPDVPHNQNMTSFYKDYDKRLTNHQVWFPIVYGNNSRYVHVGNLSDGCTTVVDLALWGEVFEALISHRGKDGQSVGILVVEGKPAREK